MVLRGLARSRSQASQLIDIGRVLVNGKVANKAALKIEPSSKVEVTEGVDYVSRAGAKLAFALEHFQIPVAGTVLDAGASTGGFTQVLLEAGAKEVLAIDVGHAQLVPELANDPRVHNLEGVNLRDFSRAALDALLGKSPEISLVVADLSFISLTLVLENLTQLAPLAPMVLLVKPQFEVGKHSLNASGVVTDWRERARALQQVTDYVYSIGYAVKAMTQSPVLGTHGNVEYLLWIVPRGTDNREQWSSEITDLAKRAR
jgi:23S rRNA (cytidine1920-2'-O)/16S rRNA (cytidine1409-2'-O)-methyltransferase